MVRITICYSQLQKETPEEPEYAEGQPSESFSERQLSEAETTLSQIVIVIIIIKMAKIIQVIISRLQYIGRGGGQKANYLSHYHL